MTLVASWPEDRTELMPDSFKEETNESDSKTRNELKLLIDDNLDQPMVRGQKNWKKIVLIESDKPSKEEYEQSLRCYPRKSPRSEINN